MTTTGTAPQRAAQHDGPDRRGTALAAVAGVAAGALTVAVADLVAGLVAPGASPVVAVGGAAVDLAPGPLKDFAVATFGAADKAVLLAGTGIVLVVLSALAGVLARRRPAAGLALVGLLGAAGLAAAVTRPDAGPAAAVPTLAGVLAGAAALLRTVRPAGARPDHRTPDGAATPPGTPAPDAARSGPGAAVPARRPVLAGVLAVTGTAALAGAGGRLLAARRAAAVDPGRLVLPAPADPAPALPAGATLDVPGLTPFLTAPRDLYRVDTALVVPRVDPATWRLRVHGLVEREVEVSLDDVLAEPLVERVLTLTCVSNEVGGRLAGTGRWLGLPLPRLLERAGVRPDADMLLSTSADGWTCSTPLAAVLDGRDALLVVGLDGAPLPVEHGFPARLLVPGVYGYVGATKWVTDLEVTRFDRATAYWTTRGWAAQAPVRTASRIDVPAALARVPAGPVTLAGVAWAQRRGIERVEVRVDGGPWQAARLAAAANVDTWRQWSLVLDLAPGSRTLQVRATDGDGATQPEQRRTPRPDGATGWHTVVVRVT